MIHRRQFLFFKTFFEQIRFFGAVGVALIFAGFLSACSLTSAKKRSEIIWNKDLPVIGSLSSPRTADLNNDGVLDIVMGAGKNEFQKTDMGILAFDGKSGNLLWKQSAIDQVYGSATFFGVTGDEGKEIFISGVYPE